MSAANSLSPSSLVIQPRSPQMLLPEAAAVIFIISSNSSRNFHHEERSTKGGAIRMPVCDSAGELCTQERAGKGAASSICSSNSRSCGRSEGSSTVPGYESAVCWGKKDARSRREGEEEEEEERQGMATRLHARARQPHRCGYQSSACYHLVGTY